MRYSKTQTLTVSEDDSDQPKQIRFQELSQLTVDTKLLAETKTGDINLPAATTFDIPFGAIGKAQWFYIRSNKPFSIQIDSGPELKMKENKPNEMWVELQKLEVITTDISRITYAIAGE